MRRPIKPYRRRPVLLLSIVLLHPCASFSPVASQQLKPSITSSLKAERATTNISISPLRAFYSSLNSLYDTTQLSIKCPFMRRRVADCLDGTVMFLQFLLIRHKSLGLSDPTLLDIIAPGCKPTGRHIKTTQKCLHLPLSELESRILDDWDVGSSKQKQQQGKGYYITGRLDTTIFRDDCLFTGPDPDMPVRGLRKYLSATAQLFDTKSSFAILNDISIDESSYSSDRGVITVQWTLGGIINLPWHPIVEPWTGWTKYHIDEEGLICWHEEGWDVEAWRIFIGVVFPSLRNEID